VKETVQTMILLPGSLVAEIQVYLILKSIENGAVFPQCDIISISLSVDKRVFVILMATRL
jgi:hypothetical protein